jgi:hypothetical protein
LVDRCGRRNNSEAPQQLSPDPPMAVEVGGS